MDMWHKIKACVSGSRSSKDDNECGLAMIDQVDELFTPRVDPNKGFPLDEQGFLGGGREMGETWRLEGYNFEANQNNSSSKSTLGLVVSLS